MAKTKEMTQDVQDVMEKALDKVQAEKLPIEEMPLECFRDYRLYNEEARRLNKKLRMLRYPIKQCPIELHPTQRIKFGRIDQPANPLPVHLSNHLIHYDKVLTPGETYDIPECVIHHLETRGYPVWKWVTLANGNKETVVDYYTPRFALRTVYQGD